MSLWQKLKAKVSPPSPTAIPPELLADLMQARVIWKPDHLDPRGWNRGCLVALGGGNFWQFDDDEKAAHGLVRSYGVPLSVARRAVGVLNRRVAEVARLDDLNPNRGGKFRRRIEASKPERPLNPWEDADA